MTSSHRQSLFNADTYARYEDIKWALEFFKNAEDRQAWRNADGTIEVHGNFTAEDLQALGMLAMIPTHKEAA